jgi:hypothetical protein
MNADLRYFSAGVQTLAEIEKFRKNFRICEKA